jgi:hypothetical protein
MSARDVYEDTLTLREARERYFVANKFGADGGYSLDWVQVKVGPVPFTIPNTKSRKRAVRFHDLHHTLTGYRTNFRGECEIGAWEVATGCADHWAAWFLNLSTVGSGVLFAAGDVWRAFVRGRNSANLYRAAFDDALLDRRLGDVRRELRLSASPAAARAADRVAFAGWSLVGLALLLVQVAASPVALPIIALRSRLAGDATRAPS